MVNADEVEASGPEKLPLAGAGTASEGPMEKRGRLLSGLLAVNILFLGSALVLSSIFNRESVSGTNVLLLLMALSAVAVGWMTFHRLAVPLVPHRDLHAGAIWLRGQCIQNREHGQSGTGLTQALRPTAPFLPIYTNPLCVHELHILLFFPRLNV